MYISRFSIVANKDIYTHWPVASGDRKSPEDWIINVLKRDESTSLIGPFPCICHPDIDTRKSIVCLV